MAEIAGVDVKWWAIGGVGAAGLVYWAYKRSQASAATTTDPTIDPNTGLPYGYDTGSSPVTGVTPSAYSYIDPATGQTIGLGSGVTGVIGPSTNAAWAQQAAAYLNQQGFDQIAVAVALGKYLSNQNLTDDQMSIVQAAIAFVGYPPTSVPPPHVAPPGGQTVLPITLIPPGGAHASPTRNNIAFSWNGLAGQGITYRVYYRSAKTKTAVYAAPWLFAGETAATSFNLPAQPNTVYDLSVRAVHNGTVGPPIPAGVVVTTPK
jgi:hypothetical protein